MSFVYQTDDLDENRKKTVRVFGREMRSLLSNKKPPTGIGRPLLAYPNNMLTSELPTQTFVKTGL